MAENYQLNAFRDFLNSSALIDIKSKDCAFTWANDRNGEALVKERLNSLMHYESENHFLGAEAFALLTIGSDHSSIVLALSPELVKEEKGIHM